MFLWIKVKALDDVRHLVMEECIRRGVMFVTGHAYIVHANAPCPYLRASFSLPTLKEIDEGMARLADAIKAELIRHGQIPSPKIIFSLPEARTLLSKPNKTLNAQLLRGLSDGILVQPLRALTGPLGT